MPTNPNFTTEAVFNSLCTVDLFSVVKWYQYETAKRTSTLLGVLCIVFGIFYIVFGSVTLLIFACSTLGLGIGYFIRSSFLSSPKQSDVDKYKIELLDKSQLLVKIIQGKHDKRIYSKHVVYIGIAALSLPGDKVIPNMPTGEVCCLTHLEDSKLLELL